MLVLCPISGQTGFWRRTAFKGHLDERFEKIETRLDAIDDTLAKHTRRLAELADVDALRETIRHLETRVTTLESIRSR